MLGLVARRNGNRESTNRDSSDWEYVIALSPNTLLWRTSVRICCECGDMRSASGRRSGWVLRRSVSYVGSLGPMGLYRQIAMLWNGGADQLLFPADQLILHGCVHFTNETCVCGFKMSKKWSFGPIRNEARPIVAAGRPRMICIIIIFHCLEWGT